MFNCQRALHTGHRVIACPILRKLLLILRISCIFRSPYNRNCLVINHNHSLLIFRIQICRQEPDTGSKALLLILQPCCQHKVCDPVTLCQPFRGVPVSALRCRFPPGYRLWLCRQCQRPAGNLHLRRSCHRFVACLFQLIIYCIGACFRKLWIHCLPVILFIQTVECRHACQSFQNIGTAFCVSHHNGNAMGLPVIDTGITCHGVWNPAIPHRQNCLRASRCINVLRRSRGQRDLVRPCRLDDQLCVFAQLLCRSIRQLHGIGARSRIRIYGEIILRFDRHALRIIQGCIPCSDRHRNRVDLKPRLRLRTAPVIAYGTAVENAIVSRNQNRRRIGCL